MVKYINANIRAYHWPIYCHCLHGLAVPNAVLPYADICLPLGQSARRLSSAEGGSRHASHQQTVCWPALVILHFLEAVHASVWTCRLFAVLAFSNLACCVHMYRCC